MLHVLLIYGTLAACALGIAMSVRTFDLHEKEPFRALLLAMLCGAGLMYLAGRVQATYIYWLSDTHLRAIGNIEFAFLAGLTEEIAKLLAVCCVFFCFRRHFNEPLDGLIYGAFAGLGAAIEESIWFLHPIDGLRWLPLQEPVRLAGHLIMGGIGGAGLGLLPAARPLWPLGLACSLVFAILVHFLWDIAAFEAADSVRDTGKALWWHNALAISVMLIGYATFRAIIVRGGGPGWKRGSRREPPISPAGAAPG